MKPKTKILIIAGSDSSGGAGIQADIKTVTALGSYAMTAITAVTSQNTTGLKSIVAIPSKEISKQIEFTSKDIKPDAIKIGMLHSVEVINAVLKSLNKINVKKIILDPVMVAKGGTKLIDNHSIRILKSTLIKKASKLLNVFKPLPQILENIVVKDKNIINKFKCKNAIKKANKLMSKEGRVLVRKSGTEPKIRVMAESNNKSLIFKCIKIIKQSIKNWKLNLKFW